MFTKPSENQPNQPAKFGSVFMPCTLTILGVIMFRRLATSLANRGTQNQSSHDIFGVGLSGVEFTRRIETGPTAYREIAKEVFYQVFLPRRWNLNFDLQSVNNPVGIAARSASLVSTLRVTLQF